MLIIIAIIILMAAITGIPRIKYIKVLSWLKC